MKRFLIFVFICFAALANAQTYTEASIPLAGTATATGIYTFSPTINASTGLARVLNVSPSLNATANNDILVALDVNPTFGVGAYSGVTSYAARFGGSVVPNLDNTFVNGGSILNWQSVRSRIFESTTGQLLLRTTTASSMQFAINSIIVGNVFGSSGNWQLGASSPVDAGYKFDVQGTARFTGTSVFENAVGIRNGTPETSLDVVATADAPIFSTAYSNGQSSGGVMSRRARGTQAAPLAVQANDLLGGVFARAHNGSNFTGSSNAGIYIYSAQNWTPSINSTYVTIETTTLNSAARTEKLRITPDGAVGINQATPAASAILDIVSTNRGVLLPRMTQVQRTAITSPATGLIVYQTDGTEGVYVYKSGGWVFAF